jgi:hypothetical protein
MKKPILLLFAAIFSLASFCQVSFESITFQQALQKAKESGRLIFLQLDAAACDQCNEVADKGLEDPKLATQLEQGFICIRLGADHPDRNKVADLYNKEKFFGSLFISSDATLLHSFPRTTSLSSEYFKQIDIALTKASEGLRISEFEKEYKKGNRSIALLEQLLQLRKTLYLNTDTLLDEYVSLLPVDSLQSPATIIFIAKLYPIAGSKADALIRKDYALFNKAWYQLSLPERKGINNMVIYKSMQKAIRDKSLNYAYQVAAFARATNTANIQAGNKAFDSNLLEFYKGTNDTSRYLKKAVDFFDNYYMALNVDSVKQKDSLNKGRLFAKQVPQKTQTGNSVIYKKEFSYAPIIQTYARALNDGAWTFYKWTNESQYLGKALQWSHRAIELFQSPEAMDTYARLLYKTGKKNEAIEWESKAIELKKKRGYKTADFEKVLANIKAGKPVIDN